MSVASKGEAHQTASRLSQAFTLDWSGLNVSRALVVLAVLGVPLVVMEAAGWSVYWVSLAMGALFTGLSDPGGQFGHRASRGALFALIGAGLTALGFAIGDGPWGWVVLAAFVVTLAGGLAVKYGLHRFVAGYLLNCWFIIAIGLPAAYKLDHETSHVWAQTLAWVAGCAFWVAIVGVMWLARGRKARPQPIAEIPGDISPRELTRPLILFAVIRALAVSIAVAIAFGLHLPNAYWMPIATIVAMKASLEQSTLIAEERLIGASIGALIACLALTVVDNKYVLEILIVALGMIGGSIRGVNYTLYAAAIAGCVLIASGLSHPSGLGAEGRRVLFTFAGVAIAVLVMLLAAQLQKRSAAAAPQSA